MSTSTKIGTTATYKANPGGGPIGEPGDPGDKPGSGPCFIILQWCVIDGIKIT